MKLKYLLSALIASAFVFAGCEDESKVNDGFDNVKVSDSYLTIQEAGGSATITVNADEDWYLVQNENWPEKITFNKDANGKTIKAKHDVFGNLTNDESDIASRTPAWLAADKLQGSAGETTVTFSADATSGGREFELTLVCGNNRQFIRVRQGSLEAVSATCKDVIDGPDGKTYQVKGVCTAIANTTYGNWYLNDGTGEVYIYGTLDANGAEKNFASLGLEIGDEVEVSGPKTTYGTTIELVNVTVLSIKKSLAKVLTESATYTKEAQEFELRVAYKGGNFDSEIPAEYKSWISILGVKSIAGVPSKIEPSPADTAVVTVGIAANEAGDRTGKINFASGSSEVYYEFTQEGAVLDASIAEFLAAEEGQTQYRVKGVIKSISTNSQYHNANITVVSTTGEELYLYRVVTSEGNIEDLGLAVRDIVTVVGKRGSYKGSPQMAEGGVLESYEHYEGKTIPEFLALTTSDTNLYTVYGKIVEVTDLSESFNNVCLTIKDEEGNQLYIYRCKAYDGINVADVNPEVGGYVAVCGKYGEYKGAKQMASGGLILNYYKPEPGTDPEPDPGTDPEPSVADISFTDSFLPTTYPTEETAVTSGEYGLAIYNVANYGNGIQMKKGGSYIYNTTAFGKIKSIKLNVPDGKTWYKDNLKLYAGSSANPTTEIAIASSDETGSVYDLSAGDYSYIKIENPSNYAVYMKSIDIYLAK